MSGPLRVAALLVVPMVLLVGLAPDPTTTVLAASALLLVTALVGYGASRVVVGAPHPDLRWLTAYDVAPTSRIPDPVRHPVRPRAPGLA
ncbi:hypothetical protein [Nocardioides speluncae]|uniref:hypothetical protein n=1 Tax=Nocardioides speluncae TaxID=2670337 RepID=UPI000D69C6FE|nr:hypothetical protein [Nocardioides speluncae]